MKAINKLFLLLGLLLVFAPAVLAANTEIKHFFGKTTSNPINNVDYVMYECVDSSCSAPTSFTPLHQGNTGGNTQVALSFPNTPSKTHYAQYFYAQCYWPQDWNMWSFGTFNDFSNNVVFEKRQDCKSVVDDFAVVNTVEMNKPLEINVQAKLDANTGSAFHRITDRVDFFPTDGPDAAQYVDHYSAATTVTLEIKDSNGNVVHTDSQSFELFWDTIKEVTFTWTPTKTGDYTATLTTQVTDCQCETSIPQSTTKSFKVINQNQVNYCYTLLNNLAINNIDPQAGDTLTVTADKISNAVDGSGSLTALPTQATLEIYRGGALLDSRTDTLSANPDTTNPVQFSYSIPVSQSGNYSVRLQAQALSCPHAQNLAEEETVNFDVNPSQSGNRAPVFDPVTDKNIEEGESLSFAVNANDPDNDPLTYSVTNLPSGATFSGQTFSWTPSVGQAGAYPVRFSVNDGTFTVHMTVTITVAPPPGGQTTTENGFGVERLVIHNINFPQGSEIRAGDQLQILMNMKSEFNEELEDVRIRAYLLDAGVALESDTFDIEPGHYQSRVLRFEVPSDLNQGVHYLVFSTGNQGTSRIKYRQITIV